MSLKLDISLEISVLAKKTFWENFLKKTMKRKSRAEQPITPGKAGGAPGA